MSNLPEIYISQHDYQRLEALLDDFANDDANTLALEDELARANVVPTSKLPADVVCMNARVQFQIQESGKVFEKRLCFPQERKNDSDDISVLSAVGSSLLGLRVGDVMPWQHNGKALTVVVQAVTQPDEA